MISLEKQMNVLEKRENTRLTCNNGLIVIRRYTNFADIRVRGQLLWQKLKLTISDAYTV